MYGEVNGVNRFCASKSAAGSASSRIPPTSAGRRASVGVRITSYAAVAATAARVRPRMVDTAAASSVPLTARARVRSHRVSGSSRCSSGAATGTDPARTAHTASKAGTTSGPNGGGTSSTL